MVISNNFILNEKELLSINKQILVNFIKKHPIYSQKHLDILSNCIVKIDDEKEYTFTLDTESCHLVYTIIKANPQVYFNTFIKSEKNYIICESYWKQIFSNGKNNIIEIAKEFKELIHKPKYDSYEKITTVRNFWALYENNDYKWIGFKGIVNLEEKISKGLVVERKQLDEILELKKEFEKELESIKEFEDYLWVTKRDYLTLDRVKDFCETTTLDLKILLKGFQNTYELIEKIDAKDSSGNYIYYLPIYLTEYLRNYDLRVFKFREDDDLKDAIDLIKSQILREENRREKKHDIISFNYSSHDGILSIGKGEQIFDLKFSTAGSTSIHIYSDPENIEAIAVADGASNFKEIVNVLEYDYSSRTRTLKIEEIGVFKNIYGYYAALKILDIALKDNGARYDEVRFEYIIQSDKDFDFNS